MIRINNQVISPIDITFSQTAFSSTGSGQRDTYEISVEKDFFLHAMRKHYADCVAELMQDDAITGDFDPPYPGALEYPPLGHFIETHPKYFYSFFYTFMKFDFFSLFFAEENPNARFLITSLEEIDQRNDNLVFRGEARILR